ncbi:PIF1-like helicase-domain-containing protein [Lobosporangium transversale]|uniref:ATP-dependent DNA helicase n=1 Tax=Lobosporangium transversale TaxID=64571 RepID=A0A1Y2GE01_9FUNG|nr:PIF1-like helicase-domain-containing protein [Lobosporangium transversale]ORZ08242.1 PIF1-like helicase-domain-containing protein [Lobosporangium transversale]|eukprot:XP_021878325.1 PIF1-like helicase-domain-containing protein [Lobosporangium transversale]
MLNEEQLDVIEVILRDAGLVLVTGSAGTGRSSVLKVLMHRLKVGTRFEPVVLAPSGVAAVNVGGMTIYRFFGAAAQGGGGGVEAVVAPNAFEMDWNIYCIRNRGREAFFVVDEASMISSDIFEATNNTLQQVCPRASAGVAFDGYACMLFGDFAQLAPVVRRRPRGHREWKEIKELLEARTLDLALANAIEMPEMNTVALASHVETVTKLNEILAQGPMNGAQGKVQAIGEDNV